MEETGKLLTLESMGILFRMYRRLVDTQNQSTWSITAINSTTNRETKEWTNLKTTAPNTRWEVCRSELCSLLYVDQSCHTSTTHSQTEREPIPEVRIEKVVAIDRVRDWATVRTDLKLTLISIHTHLLWIKAIRQPRSARWQDLELRQVWTKSRLLQSAIVRISWMRTQCHNKLRWMRWWRNRRRTKKSKQSRPR